MARVLGMGYALMERTVRMEAGQRLESVAVQDGADLPIGLEALEQFLELTASNATVEGAGGSVANTLRALAALGLSVGLIGKVGQDALGEAVYNSLRQAGVSPILYGSPARTGHRFNLLLEEGGRARITFLGASATLNSGDLNPRDFAGFDIFHLEGSSVANHALFSRALAIARDAQALISMDLGILRIIDAHREFLHCELPGRVDILFADEEKARAFTGHDGPEALEALSQVCPTVVIKRGACGAIGKSHGQYATQESAPAACEDSSGASDLFNAGFLYGVAHQWPLEASLRLGHMLAGMTRATFGPHLGTDQWAAVRATISQMEL